MAVQYALVFPVLLLALVGLLQAGLYFHSLNGVRHAADRAVHVAQQLGGTSTDGVQAAQQVMSQTSTVDSVLVEVDRGQQFVSARVSAQSVSLLYFWSPTVSASAEGPVERWTDP